VSGESPFKGENWFPMEWTDQGCSWVLIPSYGSDIDQSGNLYRPPTSYFHDVAPAGVTQVLFSFYARSDTPVTLTVELSYTDENSKIKGIVESVSITSDWAYFAFTKSNLDLWANSQKRITAFYSTFDIGSAWPDPVVVDVLHVEGYVPAIEATRTPVPTTPQPTATPRPSLWNKPTSTATPAASPSSTVAPQATKQFPARYSFVPTSIPPLAFPTWPAVATIAPISTPATPISMALLPTPNFPDHSYVPAPGEPTPTPLAWTTDVVSFTTWLSTSATINATDTFTIATAPEWYASSLPRPLADVGWTFEQMQSGADQGQRYSLGSWAALAGHTSSLPIQLSKSVRDLFRFLGPFGLFITWLLVMLPLVLFFKIFEFLKNLVIRVFNFVLDLIGFILGLIKLIPFV